MEYGQQVRSPWRAILVLVHISRPLFSHPDFLSIAEPSCHYATRVRRHSTCSESAALSHTRVLRSSRPLKHHHESYKMRHPSAKSASNAGADLSYARLHGTVCLNRSQELRCLSGTWPIGTVGGNDTPLGRGKAVADRHICHILRLRQPLLETAVVDHYCRVLRLQRAIICRSMSLPHLSPRRHQYVIVQLGFRAPCSVEAPLCHSHSHETLTLETFPSWWTLHICGLYSPLWHSCLPHHSHSFFPFPPL